MLHRALVSGLLITLLPAAASGADITVGPGQSIQAAINAASLGDNILVLPGVYTESIDFLGKGVRVVGVGGAGITILDATGFGAPAVVFQSNESALSILEGMTVTGGTGVNLSGGLGGGGVHCTTSATPLLRFCRITKNAAGPNNDGTGGGVLAAGAAHPTLERCRVDANRAASGGGVATLGQGSIELVRCEIDGNTAQTDGGGGLGSLVAERCVFRGNVAAGSGGGMGASSFIPATLSHCEFIGNQAGTGGGFSMTGQTFGGSYPPVQVNRCRFIENTATIAGGGAYLNTWGFEFISAVAYTTKCVFGGNQAPSGSGLVTIANSDPFYFFPIPSLSYVTDCTFANNGPGAQIQALGGGPGVVQVVVGRTIVRGTSPPLSGTATPVVSNSDIEGGFPGTGNFDKDPLFTLTTLHDYHLRPSSPCRDTGGAVPTTTGDVDFEGDAMNVSSTGTIDVGADEFHPRLYLEGAPIGGGTVSLTVVDDPSALPVLLFIGAEAAATPIASPYGPFSLAPPYFVLVFPPLQPAGTLTLAGSLPASAAYTTAALQAFSGSRFTNVVELNIW